MKSLSMRIAAVTLVSALPATAPAEVEAQVSYFEPLRQLQMARGGIQRDVQKARSASVESMHFDAFGKRFDLRLEPNHALLDAVYRSSLDGDIGVYRGEIDGVAGSWVRLVIDDNEPRGMLSDGNQLWAIDVVAGQPAIFRLEDLSIEPGMLSCSHVGAATNAGVLAEAVLAETASVAALGPGATSQLNMAIIGDYEFTTAKGAGADAALIARMNNVDGIFSAQLGVQLNINRSDTYPANNDPFTDQTIASTLLDELVAFRQSTPSQNVNGLTHLFTGRDLDTTTVGLAYMGALCNTRYGAGLTQGTHSLTTDSLIAAHEIGHNFNAPHDGTSGSVCESEPQTFIMAPTINGSSTFSSCSISEMQSHVNGKVCITPLPSTDVALVVGSQPGTVLLGNPATFTFEANSVGTMTANNVAVNMTIPPNVTLSSVTSTSGSCTSGAGTASCSIGSIASGSGATISVTASTDSTGNADFVGIVSATTDANGNNNQATVRIAIDPAVDLVSTVAASAQVALDQRITIRPTVSNLSSLAATGVTLTVTPDAGLRAESASWAPGNCSIAGNVVTCQAASIGVAAVATLQMEVTGITSGNRSYAMAVTSSESDRNTSNNNASGQITVGSVNNTGGESDSGGGSLGWVTLMLLFLATARIFPTSRTRGFRNC